MPSVKLLFIKDWEQNIIRGFEIDGSKCGSIKDLYEQFSAVLRFPKSFGHDINALDNYINDLSWLNIGASFAIIITNCNQLLPEDDKNLKELIKTLNNSTGKWEKKATKFRFFFTCEEEFKKDFFERAAKLQFSTIELSL